MNRPVVGVLAWIVLALTTAGVLAEPSGGAGLGLTAKVGTAGLGGDVTIGLVGPFNARVGYNFFDLDIDIETDKETDAPTYESELSLQTVCFLLDWHCFGGGFRVTAGMVQNNNNVKVFAEQGATIEIGNAEYTVAELEGEVAFEDMVPYAGIGYGDAIDRSQRWHFAFDLGVIFQGSPDVEITATAANPLLQSLFAADVEEEEQEIEDAIEGLTLYPVISIGLSYRF